MRHKKLWVSVGLALIAIQPIAIGSIQVGHFATWLLADEYLPLPSGKTLALVSAPLLVIVFFTSILEHFCHYYRAVIVSVLYLHTSCFLPIDWFPSVLFFNCTNIAAALVALYGMFGCLEHFIEQINDFIRYVRAKQSR